MLSQIPQLGFGTYKLTERDCHQAVTEALKVGYRQIDTADYYQNHTLIADVLKESRIPRHALWLTSKLWPDSLHPAQVEAATERFLTELQTDYLDLLLIHWPNRDIPLAETLGAMDGLKQAGKVRHLGVSNFTIHHLQDALATGYDIYTNQVELHPSLTQPELQAFCDAHDILITAYAPLARGADFDLPEVQQVAQQTGRSPAQVILAWHLANDRVAIPKASSGEHIRGNLAASELKLTDEQIQQIDQADRGNRQVNPAVADFGY